MASILCPILSPSLSWGISPQLPSLYYLILPPYTALSLAGWIPKPRPSAVGACAEHQAEGAEASSSLLQF